MMSSFPKQTSKKKDGSACLNHDLYMITLQFCGKHEIKDGAGKQTFWDLVITAVSITFLYGISLTN